MGKSMQTKKTNEHLPRGLGLYILESVIGCISRQVPYQGNNTHIHENQHLSCGALGRPNYRMFGGDPHGQIHAN
jgi:hypothetical protein